LLIFGIFKSTPTREFMEDFEDSILYQRDDIPNVAIVKYRDNNYRAVKFEYSDGNISALSTELESNTHGTEELAFPDLREDQICFARIAFEFELDDDEGLMEISLYETVDINIDGTAYNVEDIIKNDIHEMIEIYIEHIDTFYKSF
jgi:hypothetical protein